MNRLQNSRPRSMELVELTPVIVGGSSTDPNNKAWVTRKQHFELVRYWNKTISELRKQEK
ncbi:hypothetical protein B1992_14935 [Pseudoxanthomonas broegbernensis]|uniref:Uncharacterized protein n=1 Tax=Pseudoxanthomonas broegbernensis TaxID=83619 RepID=A0A7V8K5N3_9GAMM|nr:hypothetical protein B1992_14935 [Pseudoxanthomonas broegbernensis]